MADRRLQVFHAVAKHLSFTKAAEALFMTQPAVTFQIKQLEEHFNTRLFERGHGRISLTPAGGVVLDYAERILALSAELDTRLKEMTGEVAGLLMIGASTTIAEFLLPRVLGEFKSKFPKVLPRLIVANSETVESRVSEHTLDIGFIEAPSQMLEEWTWDYDTLKTFASNDQGEPIPADLVKRMNAARHFGEPTFWKRQLGLAAVSLDYYNRKPDFDLGKVFDEQFNRYSPLPAVPGTHMYAGFGHLPVCIAKTQYSFSSDASVMGAPTGHTLPVREVRLSAGAGFVVVFCGDIMTMPGLPRVPSAESIDLTDDGRIVGLF